MKNRRLTAGLTALALSGTAVAAAAAPAQAAERPGTQSLATVLAADGKGFDRNIPALRQILESDQLSPTRKAQALEDFTLLLFHQLGGGLPASEREDK